MIILIIFATQDLKKHLVWKKRGPIAQLVRAPDS